MYAIHTSLHRSHTYAFWHMALLRVARVQGDSALLLWQFEVSSRQCLTAFELSFHMNTCAPCCLTSDDNLQSFALSGAGPTQCSAQTRAKTKNRRLISISQSSLRLLMDFLSSSEVCAEIVSVCGAEMDARLCHCARLLLGYTSTVVYHP